MSAFGVLSNRGHGLVVTAILIAMVAMLATAVSYGKMARVYPSANGLGNRNGELVKNVLVAANGWQVAEIRTEEGRLDEVFRSITLPDTGPVKPENQLAGKPQIKN